ncbi:MAG TPA: SpoOM family protein, partial [Lentzea sp.]
AISGWLEQVAARSATNPAFGGGGLNPAFSGGAQNPAFGGQPGYGGYDHQDQRRGPGMGGMLAAGAAGVAGGVLGGMALGGVADEFFGDDEG